MSVFLRDVRYLDRRTGRLADGSLLVDENGVTLAQADSRSKDLREKVSYGGNISAAKIVGTALAECAKEKSIGRVCFDRNGYKYHGRIKALAEAAREGGLVF